MENAADALKIAGAVIIFVLALSIIILAFTEVRETSDIILDYRDRETAYIDGNYYYNSDKKERVVSLETVIPSIFRAYLENYKIVFVGLEQPIYSLKQNIGEPIKKFSLDLENNKNPYKLGDTLYDDYQNFQNVSIANDAQKCEFLSAILYRDFEINQNEFQKKFNVTFPNVPDVNKTQKRIITYTVK